jgi:hypothetical protein
VTRAIFPASLSICSSFQEIFEAGGVGDFGTTDVPAARGAHAGQHHAALLPTHELVGRVTAYSALIACIGQSATASATPLRSLSGGYSANVMSPSLSCEKTVGAE